MAQILLLFTLLIPTFSAEATHSFSANKKNNLEITAAIVEKVLNPQLTNIDHFAFNCTLEGQPKSCLVQFARMQLVRKNNCRAFSQHLKTHHTHEACVQAGVISLKAIEGNRYVLEIEGYRAKKNELILHISFHHPVPNLQKPEMKSLSKDLKTRTSPLPNPYGLTILIPGDADSCKVISTLMHLIERIGAAPTMWEVQIKLDSESQKTLFESLLSSKGLENFKLVDTFNPAFPFIAICYPGANHLIDPVTPTLEAFKAFEGISVTGQCQRPMKFGEMMEILEDTSKNSKSGWFAFIKTLLPNLNTFSKESLLHISEMTTIYTSPTILYIENYNQ